MFVSFIGGRSGKLSRVLFASGNSTSACRACVTELPSMQFAVHTLERGAEACNSNCNFVGVLVSCVLVRCSALQ